MGDVFANPMDLIDVALKLQDATGIKMSAAFNNTLVQLHNKT